MSSVVLIENLNHALFKPKSQEKSGDKTAALSALRDMLEALNRSWDGGGLYPHLLPGTQVAVGSVLLPGLLLELQREPELAFLQDEPEFQALLKRYGGGTH